MLVRHINVHTCKYGYTVVKDQHEGRTDTYRFNRHVFGGNFKGLIRDKFRKWIFSKREGKIERI